jgi:hypothetical protein
VIKQFYRIPIFKDKLRINIIVSMGLIAKNIIINTFICCKRIGIKTFITLAISFIVFYEAHSQPNPINIETVNLYKHGTNSSNIVGPVAGEATDSISVGSTTKYYSMPDGTVNPAFNFGLDPYSNVVSTFTWTVTASISSVGAVAVPAHPAAPHYRQIAWTSAGIGTIQVTERSSSGCDGTMISTPVEVIAVPTVQFSSTNSLVCRTEADGSINYSLNALAINWTSSVSSLRQLRVNIIISCSNAGFGAPQTHNNITVTETGAGTGTFDLPIALNYFGLYTITLTTINDRISTKSVVNGTVGAAAAYSFILSKTPSANPVYHVPNN